MRGFLLLLIFVQLINPVIATEKYPAGCYMGFSELKNQAPSMHCKLLSEKRTGGEKFILGGNDFSLFAADDKCLSKKEIRNEMLAYSDGDRLYLNGWKMHLQGAYAEVVTQGTKFLAFYGAMTNQEALGTSLMWGIAGGAASAATRYLYIIDLKTGNLYYAVQEYFERMLTDFPELKKLYERETNKESDETMLKYLNLCNQSK
jgi:hypothetical protein